MRVNIPPVWELVLTILATYALTGVIDHDRPLITVWQLLRGEVAAPRLMKATKPVRVSTTTVRVRSTRDGAEA
jgi:hypothetical protein